MRVNLHLRRITPAEVADYIRAVEAGFGFRSSDEEIAGWSSLTEVDRTAVVFDGDDMVGTSGAFSLEVSVPGGRQVKASGVTAVTVRATHRRRGLLRQMMDKLLDDARERGEPLAVLTASESHIYGRFGFGAASFGASVSIATDRSGFRAVPDVPGRFRMVDDKTVRDTFPAIHDAVRRRRPGDIGRTDPWWDLAAVDSEIMRNGAKKAFRVLHEDAAGNPDGYATYRYSGTWEDGNPAKAVSVDEVVAAGTQVELALWRYLLDLDLVATVKAELPLDSVLRWALVEPRRYLVKQVTDQLWVRLLDVPAALSARTYSEPGHLVIRVLDEATFRLSVDENGVGVCEPSTEEPDVTLGHEELGSVYLGAVRFTTLSGAGRADGSRSALRRADAMFASEHAPFLSTGF